MSKTRSIGSDLGFGILRVIISILYFFPMSAIYGLVPLCKFILESISRYRKAVIKANLINSLPSYSRVNINATISSYYEHLAEVALENLKLFATKNTSRLKFEITNPTFLDQQYRNGQDVIMLSGHLGNWEVGFTSASQTYKHQVIGIYKQQTNEKADKYLLEKRLERGVKLIEQKTFSKEIMRQSTTPRLFMLIPDQNPSASKRNIVLDFMNQATLFNTSIERIAIKNNIPMVYGDITKLNRGHYRATMLWISENSKDTSDHYITKQYAKLLERNIISNPSIWLWSHRRWKESEHQ